MNYYAASFSKSEETYFVKINEHWAEINKLWNNCDLLYIKLTRK